MVAVEGAGPVKDYEVVHEVDKGLYAVFREPNTKLLAIDNELDEIFPVGTGCIQPSEAWRLIRQRRPEVNSLDYTRDHQLTEVFAHVASLLVPNEVSPADRIQNIARWSRAIQAGIQARFTDQGVETPRDWSEAYTARLLHKAQAQLTPSLALEFRLATKECHLDYNLLRRAQVGAIALKRALA